MSGIEEAAAVIAIVGTVAATATTVVSMHNASVAAETEGAMRTQEAESARQSAAYEETQFRRRAALLIGKENAIAGASGVDIESGSPLFSELDNVRQAEIESLNIRRTGELTATAKEFEARMAHFRGATYSSQMGGTILGGLASGAGAGLSAWSKYNKNTSGLAVSGV